MQRMRTKWIRSAMPIYVGTAVFLLVTLKAPLISMKAFFLAFLLGAAAYVLSEKLFFRGREVQVESRVDTGDREVDKQVEEGRAQLKALRERPTQDPLIDTQIARMYDNGMKVFEAVAQKPEKAPQVRKFMNYYLPTTAKLMQNYFTLREVGGSGEHVTKALADIRNTITRIGDAFEKQLDTLYRAEAMDVSTDIDVMEAMIVADGLTDDGVARIMKEDKGQ